MTTQIIDAEVKTKLYERDIIEFEKYVKDLRRAQIEKISELADRCYNTFNDLQIAIVRIKDQKEKDKYEKQCYEETYDFLVFVENKVNPDFSILLLNNSPSFNKLIKHYNKYCSKMEEKYNIQLDIERKLLNK